VVDEILEALEQRDVQRFGDALNRLGPAVPGCPPSEAGDAARRLAAVLPALPYGIGSNIAPIVGALCDYGADPADVLPTLVDRACAVLADAARFKTLAARVGIEVPGSSDGERFGPTVEAVLAGIGDGLPGLGVDRREAVNAVEAWFSGGDWVQPVLFLSQRKEVRRAMPQRAELSAAVALSSEDIGTAHWLDGLLRVLDDEPLVRRLDESAGPDPVAVGEP